jgi:hypothetical protein
VIGHGWALGKDPIGALKRRGDGCTPRTGGGKGPLENLTQRHSKKSSARLGSLAELVVDVVTA